MSTLLEACLRLDHTKAELLDCDPPELKVPLQPAIVTFLQAEAMDEVAEWANGERE